MSDKSQIPRGLANYCVCFLDLLGQRKALEGHSLVHLLSPDGDPQKAIDAVKPIIGPIIALQDRAERFLKQILDPRLDSPRRMALPPELRAEWDQMQKTQLTTRYWSDGIVSSVCLGDPKDKCPMNGVFGILGSIGSQCLIGLGTHAPLRGGIDIAWGIELRQGELYGAAIARSYELESQVAQYPRVIIGRLAIDFLNAQVQRTEQDRLSSYNRELARICLGMVHKDRDGQYILHYLGDAFRQYVSTDQNQHIDMYNEARAFVVEQKAKFESEADTKLAGRYAHLLSYFDEFAPS